MLPALLEESAPISRHPGARGRLIAGLTVALVAVFGLTACGGGERQDADEPEGEFPVEIVSADFAPAQRLAQTSELTLTVRNSGEETIPDLAITVFTDPDTTPDIDASDADDPDASSDEAADETATDADGEEIPEEQLGSAVDQALEEELEGEEESGDETEPDQELPEAAGAFHVISEQPGLAIPSRPVWILEQGYPRIAGTEAGPAPAGELSGTGGSDAVQTNTFSFGELEPDETREVVWLVTAVQPGTYTVHYRVAAGLQGKAVAVNDDGSVPEGEFVVRITDLPPQTRVNDAGEVVPIKPSDIIGQAGTDEQLDELDEDVDPDQGQTP
jgi:hypothetical protein